MASSEIEVLSSDSKPQQQQQQQQQQPPILDVFAASIHGDFQKLRTFVEQDGASVSLPDVNGNYALQWASLNNFHDIVHYLIQVSLFYSPFFFPSDNFTSFSFLCIKFISF
jgi:palmitoyltransferase